MTKPRKTDARLSKHPRVSIYKDGKATLSGISYRDLGRVFVLASLYLYDHERKPESYRDPEDAVEAERFRKFVQDTLKEAMSDAVRQANGSYRLTKKQRAVEAVERVKQDRKLNEVLNKIMDDPPGTYHGPLYGLALHEKWLKEKS